jgi:hypothetical protein
VRAHFLAVKESVMANHVHLAIGASLEKPTTSIHYLHTETEVRTSMLARQIARCRHQITQEIAVFIALVGIKRKEAR